ncbi:MAG: hypothetical protein JWO94_2044 [Verrucomicrobiaceae bacterium]|nr:hypothetical protein [Verrucomicrobiaceae bacterium]
MKSSWEILGLDPRVATEKEIKVAYARLIKQHRPDSDPEGFQRVREAYETALSMLKNRLSYDSGLGNEDQLFHDGRASSSSGQEEKQNDPAAEEGRPPPLPPGEKEGPWAEDSDPSATPKVQSQPPALIEAELAIHHARETHDREALIKIIASLQGICLGLRPGRGGISLWQEVLHRAAEGNAALVAESVPLSQLIHELESGSAVVNHAVISHWESLEEMDNLIALAEALIGKLAVSASASGLRNSEAAIVALRLAVETAFVKPVLSTVLVRFAFPHVDRQARDSLIPKVEEQAAIGKLMPGLRKDQMTFWHKRLRNTRIEWDWKSPEAEAALDYLARQMEPQWGGFGIIKQVVPAEWFARLEKETGRRQGGLMGRFRATPLARPRPVRQASSGKNWGGYGWIIFLVISTLVRLLPLIGDHSSTSHRVHPNVSSVSPAAYPKMPYLPYPEPAATPYSYPRNQNLPASSSLNPPPSTLLLEQRMRETDESVRRFKDNMGSMPDGLEAARTLARNLRADDKSMNFWLDKGRDIEKQAILEMKGQPPQKVKEIGERCMLDFLGMIKQVHTSSIDPGYEKRFLNVLLIDPDTSSNLRRVALARMADTQPTDVFLPRWEEAVRLIPRTAQPVGRMAQAYLDHKGVNCLEDERKRLRLLAEKAK